MVINNSPHPHLLSAAESAILPLMFICQQGSGGNARYRTVFIGSQPDHSCAASYLGKLQAGSAADMREPAIHEIGGKE
jgi:hypothetical protein